MSYRETSAPVDNFLCVCHLSDAQKTGTVRNVRKRMIPLVNPVNVQ